jgi:prepilin-type N-terminal cleavage/methylation domain-containing protein
VSKGFIQARGFTLVEVLISIAILTLLAGLGLFVTVGAYQGSVSRSERDIVVSLLERARSRAMANVGQSSWGLCFIAPNYILFKGECTSDSDREVTAAGVGVVVEGLGIEGVAFDQLSGSSNGATITLKKFENESQRVETITINHAGTISW